VPLAAATPKGASLDAVALRAPNDVWAVGARGGKSPLRTLIEHWDGKRWRVVRSPNVGTGPNALDAVTAISRDDVWAVGRRGPEGQGERALIEHWDGREWRVVPAPRVGNGGEELSGVAGTAATDVWAVGVYGFGPNGGPVGLIEHWDGKNWTAVTSPDLGNDFNGFNAVAARSPTDVWAVGSNNANPLIEHWDGTTWTVVRGVDFSGFESYLNAVSVAPTGDVWAVGQVTIGPLVEHWDGTRWTSPRIPRSHYGYLSARETNAVLYGVTAIVRNAVWATGYRLERWDGNRWHAGSPRTGGSAITALSSKDIWDVGGKRITHYACR
jgi:hypothetical protein